MMRLLLAIGVVAVPALVLFLYRYRSRHAAIVAARRLGMKTTRARRELAAGGDGRLEPGYCLRSDVELRFKSPYNWRLLQRPGSYHPALDNDWQLDGLPTQLPQALAITLRAVTKEWRRGLMEIEGTERELSAFWNELGGASEAERVHRHVQLVADALAQSRFVLRPRPRDPAAASNYEFDILEGDRVAARYWFDFRGDDHGVVFNDGREVWLQCRCGEFVTGGGDPNPLLLTPMAIAWLESELNKGPAR